MELSKRLQAVADLLQTVDTANESSSLLDVASRQMRIADVGCDHGYIPIYLLEQKIVAYAIAMDVNQGPLEKAKEHIREHHLEEHIETRLSDGLSALHIGEVQAVIIAGMGGGLIIKILNQDRRIWDDVGVFILQPQSELFKVRTFLKEQGFQILVEDMVLEDAKYYPMMKVAHRGTNRPETDYEDMEMEYGPFLLRNRHGVLKQFLEREIQIKKAVLLSLNSKSGSHIESRVKELTAEVRRAKDALQRYYQ